MIVIMTNAIETHADAETLRTPVTDPTGGSLDKSRLQYHIVWCLFLYKIFNSLVQWGTSRTTRYLVHSDMLKRKECPVSVTTEDARYKQLEGTSRTMYLL